MTLRAELADLVLGRACAGCDRGGALLCDPCWTALLTSGPYAPRISGLQVVSAWPYLGRGRRVLLAFKERGTRDLINPLAIALARCMAVVSDHPLIVIPMPPRKQSIAERGIDVVGAIAVRACQMLDRAGQPARPVAALERVGQAPRQVGRGRQERLNLSSTEFRFRTDCDNFSAPVVLVDDVVTTGATLRAATACLRAAGVVPVGQITIAATGTDERLRQPG